MRKKRAKALAKLCGYSCHHPREYYAIPTGAKFEQKTYDKDGKLQIEIRDKLKFIAGKERASYQETKKMFKRGEIK